MPINFDGVAMLDKLFPQFMPVPDERKAEIWKEALFVFDTSFLLDLYRYSPETRHDVLGILESLKKHLWIPHQVAYEFAKNRVGVLLDQHKLFKTYTDKLLTECDNFHNTLWQLIDKRRHPLIQIEDITEPLKDTAKQQLQKLEETKTALTTDPCKDEVFAQVCSLFDGKIGKEPSEDERTTMLDEGKKRIDKGIPPGTQDQGKPHDEKHGDWLLWKQTLNQAATLNGQPIILVTNETKNDDWWWKVGQRTIGPAWQMVGDVAKTSKSDFLLYHGQRFLEFARTYLKSDVKDSSIEEVREVQEERDFASVDDDMHGLMSRFKKYRKLQPLDPVGPNKPPSALVGAFVTAARLMMERGRNNLLIKHLDVLVENNEIELVRGIFQSLPEQLRRRLIADVAKGFPVASRKKLPLPDPSTTDLFKYWKQKLFLLKNRPIGQ